MSVYKKSNMPTSIVRALTGRIEDVLMGYPVDSARAALAIVTTLVESQREIAPPIVPVKDALQVLLAAEPVEGPNA